MNLHKALPQINDLDNYLEKYKEVTDVPVNSYLIIWLHQSGMQEGSNDSIYCLQYHQLHELPVFYQRTGTVIAFSKNLLEMINGYTFPLFEKRLFSLYQPVELSVDRERQDSLQPILETLKNENGLETITESQGEIIRVLLKLFLLRLAEGNVLTEVRDSSKEESVLVRSYIELVQIHYVEWKRVSDYASQLCVTPNYLNAKIKKMTGYTASYHIQQRIILEAKRQARWRGLCMKEVAYHLGFADLSHFSKFFKNVTGTTFSTYLRAQGA